MKKIELLAPAGNMEALYAAVQAGCDAVYLGGSLFGARAFSKNFNNDELIQAIKYCHLYGVKVYVTVNTLIYEREIPEFLDYIRFLHQNNVDAVLMQDYGMFDLCRKKFPNLEIHASTQMHIHNLDGVKLMERLGMKRVVLARETSIDDIKNIRKNSNVELEVFVHGALCISYSGQCLMSSLIGGRSGNRGKCAGSCRLKYQVIDDNDKILNKGQYPLSTKDLNSLEHIGELIESGVNSLKIEGRMKSKEYVYMVVKMYRAAIDSYYQQKCVKISENDLNDLKKIFNRNYTKGFLFNTDNNSLINDYRPNHMGVKIGTVTGYNNGIAKIKLTGDVSIGSGLRVIGKNDVGINVNDFYCNGRLVKKATAGDIISIKVNDKVNINDSVVITLDKDLNNKIDNIIDSKQRKVIITGKFRGKVGEKISLFLSDGKNEAMAYGNEGVASINRPVDRNSIIEKLNKLGDTVYKFDELNIDVDDNLFVPLSEINELRRKAIELLNDKRQYIIPYSEGEYSIQIEDYPKDRKFNALINKSVDINKLDKKYDKVFCYEEGKDTILKIPRVNFNYPEGNNYLVGEIGAFNKYTSCYTDFSLNVVNSYTVAFLHSLGAKMVCLSYELTEWQVEDIINAYHERYGKHPNLEVIVFGYPEVMISKFSLNKFYNNNNIWLRDMFGNKYKIVPRNDLMYIYYYKRIEEDANKYFDLGINNVRFNFDE